MAFQTFDDQTRPTDGPARLQKLRELLTQQELDGFLIPRADAHQGEYVAPCDARLAWLTGFTGSAGFCIALHETAGIFIDGRYRVQVKDQVDLEHFTPVNWPQAKPADWLKEQLPEGGTIGFDPWLYSKSQIEEIKKGLKKSGIRLAPSQNLVDTIWADRPARPMGDVIAHPIELSGKSSREKLADMAEILRAEGQSACVLTLPDSICWLLNIRGSDIERNPVVQAFAILHDSGKVDLFIEHEKVAPLGPDPLITDLPPESFEAALTALGGPVRVDKGSAPIKVSMILKEAEVEISYADDPCILPKACKNPVEIEGARQAHLRDAKAMVAFLAWLDAQPAGGFSEIDVVTALEGFRLQTSALREISFDTISGTGPNGAVVHYRVTHGSNRTVEYGDLLLVDSGGQYVDGTTDITRTIAIGMPTHEQKQCFTRVLQGMIAISLARFPRVLTGRDLDPLARAALWRAGLDYDHGTGHGVGSYLSVHEGPQRISRHTDVKLQPGMILSNEPGYYREGAFGIRIENLIVVRTAEPIGDKRDMLDFETLTWVPIDRRLIDTDMLAPHEREWIDAYHAHIAQTLEVDGDAAAWLAQATAPL